MSNARSLRCGLVPGFSGRRRVRTVSASTPDNITRVNLSRTETTNQHLSISLFFFKGLVGHPSPGGPVRVGQRLGCRGAGGSGAEAAEVGGASVIKWGINGE